MILLKNIVKRHEDDVILAGLSLEIEGNGVFGLFSASVDSKKHIVNILSGVDCSFEGEVILDEESCSSAKGERAFVRFKKQIGYLPEIPTFYGDMTVLEILDFIGEAKNIEPDSRFRQIKEALELAGCDKYKNILCSKLSLSQKRRVAFAAALLGNPKMIVIDEPYVSFNEREREEIKTIIDMIGKVKPVIVVTASEDVVSSVCEKVFIISEGVVSLEGDIEDLLQKTESTKLFDVRLISKEVQGIEVLLAAFDGVEEVLSCEVLNVSDVGEMNIQIEAQAVADIDILIKEKLISNGYIVLSLDSARRAIRFAERTEV